MNIFVFLVYKLSNTPFLCYSIDKLRFADLDLSSRLFILSKIHFKIKNNILSNYFLSHLHINILYKSSQHKIKLLFKMCFVFLYIFYFIKYIAI